MANPTSHLAGVDFLSTWKRQISDLITGNGEADAPDAAEVQNKFNDQRAALRKNAHDLGFDGDYRPKAVNGTDEFDKPDLATLRAKVDKIDLEAVTGLVDAWKEIATRNTTSLDEFRKQIARGMLPDVWSGGGGGGPPRGRGGGVGAAPPGPPPPRGARGELRGPPPPGGGPPPPPG
ncbi:hypothetical protein, partial [Nocardia neocaledoniensis]|uniref:hypothetical protein n=1 Tax=Nocardia neocaledoniensis TaxID=236511 RepID=UPI0024584036